MWLIGKTAPGETSPMKPGDGGKLGKFSHSNIHTGEKIQIPVQVRNDKAVGDHLP